MQNDLSLAKELLALSAELGGSTEKPPILRIRLTRAPAFGGPDIEVPPPAPGRRVIDMRAAAHRRTQAKGLPPEPAPPADVPEARPASQEGDGLWHGINLFPSGRPT